MPFHFNYEQKYPYTDFDKINLDWILELATQLKEAAENGDFDGPPGPPGSGTATNGIAYFTTADTFADIQAAITDGMLPVLMYYNMGQPCFMYCFDHTSSLLKFGALSNTQQLQLTWYSNETKSLTTRTLISNQAPVFYGFPTLVNSLPAGDSTHKLATTSFVQEAVTTAVQAAIEQLVIAPFSESFKQALLQLAQKVAYIDGNGQTYYQALYDALYPPINVESISAVWNPPVGYVVYTTTPIDSLKTNLTVTATYDDQTTAVLDPTDYVLSGTLTAGTSTITVTYANATTTFNVTVVQNELDYITATFNQGAAVIYDTDSLADLVPYLTVTATYTNLNTVYVDYPNYTLIGTLTSGTSTITVSYGGKTATFTVTVTHGIAGWYYPFNNSIVSQGTHDFGLSGVQNYTDGVNVGELCYYHHVATEGDASTDPLGLYALASADYPTWSNDDFTIATWWKDDTENRGWMFAASKRTGSGYLSWTATASNVASGWSVSKTNANKKYAGIRLGTVSEHIYISLTNSANNAGGCYSFTPPSGFTTTQWHHYALTKDGATLYFFVDGNLICNIVLTESTELYSSNSITIGNVLDESTSTPTVVAYPYSSYHQDLYVAVGYAKWTSNFDPTAIVY